MIQDIDFVRRLRAKRTQIQRVGQLRDRECGRRAGRRRGGAGLPRRLQDARGRRDQAGRSRARPVVINVRRVILDSHGRSSWREHPARVAKRYQPSLHCHPPSPPVAPPAGRASRAGRSVVIAQIEHRARATATHGAARRGGTWPSHLIGQSPEPWRHVDTAPRGPSIHLTGAPDGRAGRGGKGGWRDRMYARRTAGLVPRPSGAGPGAVFQRLPGAIRPRLGGMTLRPCTLTTNPERIAARLGNRTAGTDDA